MDRNQLLIEKFEPLVDVFLQGALDLGFDFEKYEITLGLDGLTPTVAFVECMNTIKDGER